MATLQAGTSWLIHLRSLPCVFLLLLFPTSPPLLPFTPSFHAPFPPRLFPPFVPLAPVHSLLRAPSPTVPSSLSWFSRGRGFASPDSRLMTPLDLHCMAVCCWSDCLLFVCLHVSLIISSVVLRDDTDGVAESPLLITSSLGSSTNVNILWQRY